MPVSVLPGRKPERQVSHEVAQMMYTKVIRQAYTILPWEYLEDEKYEPRHDKTNKVAVRPAKTQVSLGIGPVWSVLNG